MHRLVGASGLLAGLFVLVGYNVAQEKSSPAEKHDHTLLHSSLRNVILEGIDLYNNRGDHAGCYRLYQGSLISIKPFLSKDLQKSVESALQNAERMPAFSDRAFELRKSLDVIRAAVSPANQPKKVEEKKVEEKKVEPKKVEEKKVEEKKVEPKKVEEKKVEPKKVEEKKIEPKVEIAKKDANGGLVSGTIIFGGEPLAAGEFVTLVGSDGKKFSTLVQKAGQFGFTTPIPPGTYRLAIEPAPGAKGAVLPARYRSETTSGVVVMVQSGRQALQLQLVN